MIEPLLKVLIFQLLQMHLNDNLLNLAVDLMIDNCSFTYSFMILVNRCKLKDQMNRR